MEGISRTDREREMFDAFLNKTDADIVVIPARAEKAYENVNIRKETVGYVRVSTNDPLQLTSLNTQIMANVEMCRQSQDMHLICMYSDKGISATQMKNREGLLPMNRGQKEMMIKQLLASAG